MSFTFDTVASTPLNVPSSRAASSLTVPGTSSSRLVPLSRRSESSTGSLLGSVDNASAANAALYLQARVARQALDRALKDKGWTASFSGQGHRFENRMFSACAQMMSEAPMAVAIVSVNGTNGIRRRRSKQSNPPANIARQEK